MYKIYKKGDVFQIDFGNGYGYIQEAGEIIDNGDKEYCVVVYERPFVEEIHDVKDLSAERFFVGHFDESPTNVIKKPIDMNQWDSYHPVKKTNRGFEFEHSIYKCSKTGEFRKKSICIKHLGCYPVQNGIVFPHHFRYPDYNLITGTYRWIVMMPFNKYVKQQKTTKGIEYMPPYLLNFSSCATWWEDKLTIDTWNDEYCQRVLDRRYSDSPENRPINVSFEEAVASMPIKKWYENCSDERRKEWCSKIEVALRRFITRLSAEEKLSIRQAKIAVKETVFELNKLQNEDFFIGTMEREDLFKYISVLLRAKKVPSAIDVWDENRDW